MSIHFYGSLPELHDLSEIANLDLYRDVPADWLIAISDVRGSTAAIEQGKYRDVNAIAAASITSLLNLVPETDLPFVFGGDGATILIPPEIKPRAEEALLATRRLARSVFDLELRVGIVPVAVVLQAGHQVRAAKLRMSENFQQAIFMGGGLAYAEQLLKDPVHGQPYLLTGDDRLYQADYSGFECRWQEVPGQSEEVVSLIVRAFGHSDIYRDVLTRISELYGDRQKRHPVTVANLKTFVQPRRFWREGVIRYGNQRFRTLLRLAYATFKGRFAMTFGIGQWGNYKSILVNSTDHEKFDDVLRMTISGTAQQREMLRIYLENRRLRGELVYGMAAGENAIITCIVFNYFGRQVHFVDGAGGGYALAAKEMKSQPLPAGLSTVSSSAVDSRT
ncbi:MAG: DUF3095 domain-containing protein [Anaerolineae bacterium]